MIVYSYSSVVVPSPGIPCLVLTSNPDRVCLVLSMDGGFATFYLGDPGSGGRQIGTLNTNNPPVVFKVRDYGSSLSQEIWATIGFGDTVYALDVFVQE